MTSLKKLALLISGLVLVGGALGAAPASAAVSTPDGQAASTALASSCTRYGYTGTFWHDCNLILGVDWGSGRLESFGIAPNRTIWHAWPGSGGWKQMPDRSGRADLATNAYWIGSSRVVEVFVDVGSGSFYCSEDPGNGRWSNWFRC